MDSGRSSFRPNWILAVLLVLLPVVAMAEDLPPPPPTEAEPSWGFFLLAILFLLCNGAVTMVQAACAAAGSATMEALGAKMGEGTRPASWRLDVLEHRLSLAGLLLLIAHCVFFARAGMLLLAATPTLGAFGGVGLALTLQLILIEVLARAGGLAAPAAVLRAGMAPAHWLTAPLAVFDRPGEASAPPGSEMRLAERHLRLLPSLRAVDRVLREETFEMMGSVREFAEATAEDIMTPRPRVEGIARTLAAPEVYEHLRATPFSRLVVHDGSMDQVVGTVLVKEVLLQRPNDPFALLRKPLFVTEKTRLPALLHVLRTNRSHLAVVLDEYGGMAGVVTLHDLFELLVGPIEEVEDSDELWIRPDPDGSFLIGGDVELSEVNEELGLELDEDEARTIGGLVFHTLGHIPVPGEEVRLEGLRLRVEEVRENAIVALRLERSP